MADLASAHGSEEQTRKESQARGPRLLRRTARPVRALLPARRTVTAAVTARIPMTGSTKLAATARTSATKAKTECGGRAAAFLTLRSPTARLRTGT